jgi:hypothetical protein
LCVLYWGVFLRIYSSQLPILHYIPLLWLVCLPDAWVRVVSGTVVGLVAEKGVSYWLRNIKVILQDCVICLRNCPSPDPIRVAGHRKYPVLLAVIEPYHI